MSDTAVVKSHITGESGFTESQAKALREVFSELNDELEELRDRVEYLAGELEVH